jgi:hypothetical protein
MFLLFFVADCRWGFVPLHFVGLESGLIVVSLAFFGGLAVSVTPRCLHSFSCVALRQPRVRDGYWFGAALCCLVSQSFSLYEWVSDNVAS